MGYKLPCVLICGYELQYVLVCGLQTPMSVDLWFIRVSWDGG